MKRVLMLTVLVAALALVMGSASAVFAGAACCPAPVCAPVCCAPAMCAPVCGPYYGCYPCAPMVCKPAKVKKAAKKEKK